MKNIVSIILALALCLGMTSAMADTLGMGHVSSISAASANSEKGGSIQINTTICSVTVDANGIITSVRFDAMQSPSVKVSATGEFADLSEADLRSKMEKGDDYGMKNASPIGKEIHEQLIALQDWCIGKTVEDAVANFADDADAKAGCTIGVDIYFEALSEAVANAA